MPLSKQVTLDQQICVCVDYNFVGFLVLQIKSNFVRHSALATLPNTETGNKIPRWAIEPQWM
jgi:hypothetical protein